MSFTLSLGLMAMIDFLNSPVAQTFALDTTTRIAFGRAKDGGIDVTVSNETGPLKDRFTVEVDKSVRITNDRDGRTETAHLVTIQHGYSEKLKLDDGKLAQMSAFFDAFHNHVGDTAATTGVLDYDYAKANVCIAKTGDKIEDVNAWQISGFETLGDGRLAIQVAGKIVAVYANDLIEAIMKGDSISYDKKSAVAMPEGAQIARLVDEDGKPALGYVADNAAYVIKNGVVKRRKFADDIVGAAIFVTPKSPKAGADLGTNDPTYIVAKLNPANGQVKVAFDRKAHEVFAEAAA